MLCVREPTGLFCGVLQLLLFVEWNPYCDFDSSWTLSLQRVLWVSRIPPPKLLRQSLVRTKQQQHQPIYQIVTPSRSLLILTGRTKSFVSNSMTWKTSRRQAAADSEDLAIELTLGRQEHALNNTNNNRNGKSSRKGKQSQVALSEDSMKRRHQWVRKLFPIKASTAAPTTAPSMTTPSLSPSSVSSSSSSSPPLAEEEGTMLSAMTTTITTTADQQQEEYEEEIPTEAMSTHYASESTSPINNTTSSSGVVDPVLESTEMNDSAMILEEKKEETEPAPDEDQHIVKLLEMMKTAFDPNRLQSSSSSSQRQSPHKPKNPNHSMLSTASTLTTTTQQSHEEEDEESDNTDDEPLIATQYHNKNRSRSSDKQPLPNKNNRRRSLSRDTNKSARSNSRDRSHSSLFHSSFRQQKRSSGLDDGSEGSYGGLESLGGASSTYYSISSSKRRTTSTSASTTGRRRRSTSTSSRPSISRTPSNDAISVSHRSVGTRSVGNRSMQHRSTSKRSSSNSLHGGMHRSERSMSPVILQRLEESNPTNTKKLGRRGSFNGGESSTSLVSRFGRSTRSASFRRRVKPQSQQSQQQPSQQQRFRRRPSSSSSIHSSKGATQEEEEDDENLLDDESSTSRLITRPPYQQRNQSVTRKQKRSEQDMDQSTHEKDHDPEEHGEPFLTFDPHNQKQPPQRRKSGDFSTTTESRRNRTTPLTVVRCSSPTPSTGSRHKWATFRNSKNKGPKQRKHHQKRHTKNKRGLKKKNYDKEQQEEEGSPQDRTPVEHGSTSQRRRRPHEDSRRRRSSSKDTRKRHRDRDAKAPADGCLDYDIWSEEEEVSDYNDDDDDDDESSFSSRSSSTSSVSSRAYRRRRWEADRKKRNENDSFNSEDEFGRLYDRYGGEDVDSLSMDSMADAMKDLPCHDSHKHCVNFLSETGIISKPKSPMEEEEVNYPTTITAMRDGGSEWKRKRPNSSTTASASSSPYACFQQVLVETLVDCGALVAKQTKARSSTLRRS